MRTFLLTVTILLWSFSANADRDLQGNISGVVTDNVIVRDYGSVSGIVNGDVLVGPGSQFMLSGVVNGRVYAGHNAEVVISGVVNGAVVNFGGSVEITGIVQFVRNRAAAAKTVARSGSYVMGRKIEADKSDFPVEER